MFFELYWQYFVSGLVLWLTAKVGLNIRQKYRTYTNKQSIIHKVREFNESDNQGKQKYNN